MTHLLDPYTYVLGADRKPVQHPNDDEWMLWFGRTDRHVARTEIGDDVLVSTIFGGIDRGYGRNQQPLVFETMIFGGEHNDKEWLAATWEEAELNHAEAVALVRGTNEQR